MMNVITFTACHYCDEEVGNSLAALWKNGVRQELSYGNKSGYLDIQTYSIIVSGNDVYVAGCERGEGTAILWKNGIAEVYPNVRTQETSMYIYNNDVYYIGNNTVWANNEKIQTLEGIATSVYVKDDDVYVAGYVYKENKRIATIWINGIAQYLTDETTYSYANSIFVSESDVYVVGTEDNIATIWKNGVAQTLMGATKATSVFVSNNNVYVVGGNKVWRNGEILFTVSDGSATAIFVSNDDVYVTTEYSVLKNGVVIQNATKSEYFLSYTEAFSSIYVSNDDVYVIGCYHSSTRVCD